MDAVMARRRPADTKAEMRAAQRAYLERALATDPQKRTLSEIARDGGMNHTTLTRFFNNKKHTGLLDALTIRRVGEVTGVLPGPEIAGGPIIGVQEGAEPYIASPDDAHKDAVRALLHGRASADPLVLRTRAIEDAGYRPGDIVILDQAATPKSGDVVCAQVYDRRGGAETVWRIFDAPYLVPASSDPAFRKPILVDNEHVVIRGVVTQALRVRD